MGAELLALFFYAVIGSLLLGVILSIAALLLTPKGKKRKITAMIVIGFWVFAFIWFAAR